MKGNQIEWTWVSNRVRKILEGVRRRRMEFRVKINCVMYFVYFLKLLYYDTCNVAGTVQVDSGFGRSCGPASCHVSDSWQRTAQIYDSWCWLGLCWADYDWVMSSISDFSQYGNDYVREFYIRYIIFDLSFFCIFFLLFSMFLLQSICAVFCCNKGLNWIICLVVSDFECWMLMQLT